MHFSSALARDSQQYDEFREQFREMEHEREVNNMPKCMIDEEALQVSTALSCYPAQICPGVGLDRGVLVCGGFVS